MENVTIVNGRENELEFDISIQGVNKKEPQVRFVVEKNSISYSFQCRREDENKWIVNIPVIPQLDNGVYSFQLEIIVDGYYFEPLEGTVEVINAPKVNASDVSASHPKPVINQVKVTNRDTNKDETTSFTPVKNTKPEKKVEKEKSPPEKTKNEVSEDRKVEAPPKQVEGPKDSFQDVVDLMMNKNETPTSSKSSSLKEKDLAVRNILKGLKGKTSGKQEKGKTFASTIDKDSLLSDSWEESMKDLEKIRQEQREHNES